MTHLGAVYATTQVQHTPWGGGSLGPEDFRDGGCIGPVAYGRPMMDFPAGEVINENANPNALRPVTTDNPFSAANRREQVGMSPSVPDCDVCGVPLDPLSKRCGTCKKHLCGSCKEDHGCLSCRLGQALVSKCGACGKRIPRGPTCEDCDERYCEKCRHGATVVCGRCNPAPAPVVQRDGQGNVLLPIRQEENGSSTDSEEEAKLREVAARAAVSGLPTMMGVRPSSTGDPRADAWGYQLDLGGTPSHLTGGSLQN